MDSYHTGQDITYNDVPHIITGVQVTDDGTLLTVIPVKNVSVIHADESSASLLSVGANADYNFGVDVADDDVEDVTVATVTIPDIRPPPDYIKDEEPLSVNSEALVKSLNKRVIITDVRPHKECGYLYQVELIDAQREITGYAVVPHNDLEARNKAATKGKPPKETGAIGENIPEDAAVKPCPEEGERFRGRQRGKAETIKRGLGRDAMNTTIMRLKLLLETSNAGRPIMVSKLSKLIRTVEMEYSHANAAGKVALLKIVTKVAIAKAALNRARPKDRRKVRVKVHNFLLDALEMAEAVRESRVPLWTAITRSVQVSVDIPVMRQELLTLKKAADKNSYDDQYDAMADKIGFALMNLSETDDSQRNRTTAGMAYQELSKARRAWGEGDFAQLSNGLAQAGTMLSGWVEPTPPATAVHSVKSITRLVTAVESLGARINQQQPLMSQDFDHLVTQTRAKLSHYESEPRAERALRQMVKLLNRAKGLMARMNYQATPGTQLQRAHNALNQAAFLGSVAGRRMSVRTAAKYYQIPESKVPDWLYD
jgi:hypothetical protein